MGGCNVGCTFDDAPIASRLSRCFKVRLRGARTTEVTRRRNLRHPRGTTTNHVAFPTCYSVGVLQVMAAAENRQQLKDHASQFECREIAYHTRGGGGEYCILRL